MVPVSMTIASCAGKGIIEDRNKDDSEYGEYNDNRGLHNSGDQTFSAMIAHYVGTGDEALVQFEHASSNKPTPHEGLRLPP